MYLGAHISIAGGVALAPERGRKVGCEAIQIFSRSPRMLRKTKRFAAEELEAFQANLEKAGIRRAIVHANYLINLGSPKASARKFSQKAFIEELERADQLGLEDVVFHPGAHLGKGERFCLRAIAEGLDRCLAKAQAPRVFAALENTAGQGSVVGYAFEQLADIIRQSSYPDRLGVCLDACHAFAAGYDFRTREGYDAVLRNVDETVGVGRLRAFHLNDSKGDLNSRVDRHENIGKGRLGQEAFRFLVNDERFRELPGCLEYPGTDPGYRRNLKLLRSLRAPS